MPMLKLVTDKAGYKKAASTAVQAGNEQSKAVMTLV
jgi:hypothetical protein